MKTNEERKEVIQKLRSEIFEDLSKLIESYENKHKSIDISLIHDAFLREFFDQVIINCVISKISVDLLFEALKTGYDDYLKALENKGDK